MHDHFKVGDIISFRYDSFNVRSHVLYRISIFLILSVKVIEDRDRALNPLYSCDVMLMQSQEFLSSGDIIDVTDIQRRRTSNTALFRSSDDYVSKFA